MVPDTRQQIRIRRAGVQDADSACAAIETLKSRSRPGRTLDEMAEWLRDRSHLLLLAIVDDHPVGFVLAYLLDRIDMPRPMVCLYEIEVDIHHRRRGIGRRLVERLRRIAIEEGAVKIWVEVDADNLPAISLYESCGARRSEAGSTLYAWPLAESALSP